MGTATTVTYIANIDSYRLQLSTAFEFNLTPESASPAAHFSMSAQGQTKTDGQTLSLSVPVNGNVTVSFSSTSTPGSAAITNYVWKSNGTQICTNSSLCNFNFGTASIGITPTRNRGKIPAAAVTLQEKLTFQ